jgi:hypothetical protein
MSSSSSPTRRTLLAASVAAAAVSLLPLHWAVAGEARCQPSKQGDFKMAAADEIRPFSFHAPEASPQHASTGTPGLGPPCCTPELKLSTADTSASSAAWVQLLRPP